MPRLWSRSFRACALYALGTALCLAGTVRADVLVTGQNESLSGELSRIVDGILVFRTSLRGQMMVPMSEVDSLMTDDTWAITDKEGAVHIGRFVPGGVSVPGGAEQEEKRLAVPMATVVSAKRLPTGMEPGKKRSETTWSGYVASGARVFEGTEDGVSPHVNLGVRGVDERAELDAELRFDVASEDGFPGYYRGRFEVAGVGEDAWAPFAQATAERDRYNALNLRTGLTVGVRYDFETKGASELESLVGLGGSYGEWEREAALRGPDGWRQGESSRSDLNVHLELRFSRALLGGATWDSRLYVLPGLSDLDHFRAGAESTLIYPVTSRLQLRLDLLMGYEHDPVFKELERVDTSLGASIQLDF